MGNKIISAYAKWMIILWFVVIPIPIWLVYIVFSNIITANNFGPYHIVFMIVFGLVVVGPMIFSVVKRIKDYFHYNRNNSYLKDNENGTRVAAEITELVSERLFRNKYYDELDYCYYIKCKVESPYYSKKHIFKSQIFLNKPNVKPGQKISVYIDKNNPEKYFVDFEDMSEENLKKIKHLNTSLVVQVVLSFIGLGIVLCIASNVRL